MELRLRSWATALVLLMAITIIPSAKAQSDTLIWRRWDVNIEINADGSFTVQEIYEIEFLDDTFTYGFRNIPIYKFDSLGKISVREGDTLYQESSEREENTYYFEKGSDEYIINFFYPPTSNDTRTFTVEYTVIGGLYIGMDSDQLYWNAIGPDHTVDIEESTVIVELPPDAIGDLNSESVAFGPDAAYSISDDLTTITYTASDISAGTNFEIGVYFSHGSVSASKPVWQEEEEKSGPLSTICAPGMIIAAGMISRFKMVK